MENWAGRWGGQEVGAHRLEVVLEWGAGGTGRDPSQRADHQSQTLGDAELRGQSKEWGHLITSAISSEQSPLLCTELMK